MACALFIVPGVPLINFVSDMLDNHIETGLVRATNTLLMIVAMSFGIAVAIKFCGIDNFVHDLSMTPHHTFVEYAIAAAISAMRHRHNLQHSAASYAVDSMWRNHRRLFP